MNMLGYDMLQKEPPFRVVAKTDLPAVEMRDGLFLKWPRTDPCTIWTIALAKSSTPVQLAAQVLNVPEDTPHKMLGRLLVSRGHLMTPAQVLVMAKNGQLDKKASISFFRVEINGSVSTHCLMPEMPKTLRADNDPAPIVVDRILVRNLNNSWPWV